ncbi:MAG: hypothetical protein QOJ62_3138 [Actinomycetota bacterium]|jgi:hypothetical protein|nr:hypothetical protein [Actinomycetota bacterium]
MELYLYVVATANPTARAYRPIGEPDKVGKATACERGAARW